MFTTKYNRNEVKFTSCGTPTRVTYRYSYDENGERQLIEDGVECTQDIIQLYKDVNDIDMLLTRYRNGDMTALNQTQGIYGDFKDVPKTLTEFYKSIDESNSEFNKLDTDIKEKFNNSPSEFFNKLITGEAAEIINTTIKERFKSDDNSNTDIKSSDNVSNT